jgi:ribokinase
MSASESAGADRLRIVVVGSSNTDLVVRAPAIPAPGETVLGTSFMTAAGGKGANQAVAAARLGASVTFVGRVGTDNFGDAAVQALEREMIDVRLVERDAEAASGVAFIVVNDAGENAIAVAPGANARLDERQVDRAADAIREADVLLLQLEIPLNVVRYTACMARDAGARVILNPAPASPLDSELLAAVDVLTPNQGEAAMLAGRPVGGVEEARVAARALRAAGPTDVVVTLGENGALVEGAEEQTHLPGVRVQSVDSTAAGDAFSAALAVGLGRGESVVYAARYATRVAALTVTRAGAQPSLPTAEEVEAFERLEAEAPDSDEQEG